MLSAGVYLCPPTSFVSDEGEVSSPALQQPHLMEVSDQWALDYVNVRHRQTWGRKTRKGLWLITFYPKAGLSKYSHVCTRSPLCLQGSNHKEKINYKS